VTFASGVGTATITLTKAETTTLTATDNPITGTSTSFTVNAGAAARLAWASATGTPGPVSNTAGTLSGGLCLFTCSYTTIGGSGSTFKAKLAVTDVKGNVVSNLGSSLSVTVTRVGGSFTGSATVTIPASGQALSNSGGDGSVAGEITFTTDSG